jgi:TonB-linked SusC/RagA family outer membrane protein
MRKLLCLCVVLMLLTIQVWAQRTVTGKVTDDKGNPLPNVSVQVKGTTSGTVTDANGVFSLAVPQRAQALVFSSIGMSTQEFPIQGSTSFNVRLSSSERNMQEVVVVGYGATQRRRELTGSISTVKGSEVSEKPVQSFDQALAGRAAGVQVTIPTGVLNTPPVFRVRGTNSLSLSSYPLIIVDGVPSFTGDFSSTNAASNALASINPNDIESIDIAKDAAATAIYGSRAANGVVFITTKKGRPGKPRVNYDVNVGWSNAYRLPNLLNAFQYTDFKNMAAANNGNVNTTNAAGAGYTHFALTNGPDGQPINTNWFDYVYRQGISQNHTLSVSGGNDNTTYYFSAGYTNQKGIIQKNDFLRSNMLFNIDSKVNNVLTVGGKISFSNEKNFAATTSGSLSGEGFNTGGLARLAIVNAPNVSPYKNDGSYNIGNTYIGSMNNSLAQVGFYNPVPILDMNRSNSEVNHIQSNAYIQLRPFSWLTLKSLYGIDYLLVDNDLFWSPIHGDGQSYGGYATNNFGKYKRWIWDNTAQLDYSFGGKHNLMVLVGNEQDRRTSSGYGLNRQTLSDPAYDVIQAGFTTSNAASLVLGENYLLSSFASLKYDFNKKYYLSGNIRQDEYSALGQKKGVFYGASAGWEIAKENFWESAGIDKIFSTFKIRGSYGKVGNTAGIGDYVTFSSFSSGLYGGTATSYFSQAGNPDLKWETSKKTDIGFSFGILKDRITGEFAWYKNDISDLILNVPQSPSTGLPNAVPLNVGKMYNKGVELTLNATPVNRGAFTWNSNFNFSYNKNEVTALAPGLSEIITSTSSLESVNKTKVGYSAGYLWVIRTAGVDPATGRRIFINSQGKQVLYQFYAPAGQFNYSNPDGTKYVSPTGGTSINQAADAVMYANAVPKYYGGWDNTFRYKGFDVDVLLTYQGGFYVYYGTNAGLHDQRFWNNANDILNAWSKTGDNASWPKPVYGDNVSNGSAMPLDINVFKGDFIKLKNLSIGYTLPKSLLGRAKISNARFYVSGQNLAVMTKYPGPDPEVSSNGNATQGQGIDRNTAANARTIIVGLNVSF